MAGSDLREVKLTVKIKFEGGLSEPWTSEGPPSKYVRFEASAGAW
jgi:hypothetical protein